LEDPDESDEVIQLLEWWNRWVLTLFWYLSYSETPQPSISQLFTNEASSHPKLRSRKNTGQTGCDQSHQRRFVISWDVVRAVGGRYLHMHVSRSK
jgi:hypothetical protein